MLAVQITGKTDQVRLDLPRVLGERRQRTDADGGGIRVTSVPDAVGAERSQPASTSITIRTLTPASLVIIFIGVPPLATLHFAALTVTTILT